jgi:hypothetical protein
MNRPHAQYRNHLEDGQQHQQIELKLNARQSKEGELTQVHLLPAVPAQSDDGGEMLFQRAYEARIKLEMLRAVIAESD